MVVGLQAGVVQINAIGLINNTALLRGVEQLRNGVDKSLHSFDKSTTPKTVQIHL
jgi:hypothetical protein